MSEMTESERTQALQRQVDDLAARLATSHEQTAQAIANTDRAIQQTADAIAQAQRYLDMYREAREERAKRHDAAHSGESK